MEQEKQIARRAKKKSQKVAQEQQENIKGWNKGSRESLTQYLLLTTKDICIIYETHMLTRDFDMAYPQTLNEAVQNK